MSLTAPIWRHQEYKSKNCPHFNTALKLIHHFDVIK
ncbi:hypothetical protein CPS_3217 [Colwellia psychrerythraea 34H]|uniref:Uncharacterized protein n=1 Tax=Colwellia psychrerythraea (strain 34H / ATCC BAA-681) TaxID=167879 RepID=Q47Z57_COLP3|nr:hypothetical protein CPS_3217 [Colwellia psychrerythraea 34H]